MSSDEVVIDLSEGEDKAYLTRRGELAGTEVEVDDGTGGYPRLRPFDGDRRWDRLEAWARQRALEGDTSFRHPRRPAKIVAPDGGVLEGKARQRVVDRLLGRYDQMPSIYDPTAPGEETRAYVPGLSNHRTTPLFAGPKGWGKTRFLAQLSAALIVPGIRLFDFFDPVDLEEHERERDVWMINPETRPGAVHESLLLAGLSFGYRDGVPCYHADLPDWQDRGVLIVEQAPRRGTQFDVTNQDRREWWVDRFIEYANRRKPPLTLIVDGVTAILGNDTTRYGEFASALMELQADADIPNGLGVLHSPMGAKVDTPMNGVESMGQWDGMWLASADHFPVEPSTPRHFHTLPRLGDPTVPKRRMVLGETGLLRLVSTADDQSAQKPTKAADLHASLHAKLAEAGARWLWTKEICGTGDAAARKKEAMEAMEARGEVVSRYHRDGRAHGYQWRLADQAADGDDA